MQRPSPLAAALVLAAFAGSGCLSHEYRIPKEELARQARLPPAERGQRVHVVQEIGERRGAQVGAGEAPPPGYAGDAHAHTKAELYLQLDLPPGGAGHGSSGAGGGGAPRPVRVAPPSGAAPRPAGPVPVPARAVGSQGGALSGLGAKAPSSGKAEDLVVVAVIVFAVAVMAAAGIGLTEGLRYDGAVDVWPGQLVYLEGRRGDRRAVPLAELTEADVAHAREALVMDDEGWGLRFVGRRPLDRRGLAFKLDAGASDLRLPRYTVAGLASHLQVGVFPHQKIGILAGVTLAGGEAEGDTVVRHTAGLELQAFPLHLWRLHLGGYAGGGLAIAAGPGLDAEGPAYGAGALPEIALTTRLALTARAGWSTAKLGDQGWAPQWTLTGGIAIY